jgi:lysophospholipase L1-like esterase
VTSFRDKNHLDSDIAGKVIPLIRQIAKKNKLDVIDLHTPTHDKAALFPDKLHPNAEGEGIIAKALYDYIKHLKK